MATIGIENMVFYGHHGVFTEEHKLGGKYRVDVYITTSIAEAAKSDDIQDTVDYQLVYTLVAAIMEQPKQLLESLVTEIGREIKQLPLVESVRVRVSKEQPPLQGLVNRVYVEKHFSKKNRSKHKALND